MKKTNIKKCVVSGDLSDLSLGAWKLHVGNIQSGSESSVGKKEK